MEPLGEDGERAEMKSGSDAHAHVEEAAEHVDDIVGVDGCEDEVAGERGSRWLICAVSSSWISPTRILSGS